MERDLAKLVVKTKQLIKNKGIEETIKNFPQSLLVIRLALNKSQRKFIRLLKNLLTQPMLIKHENGKTKRMTKKLARNISEILSKFKIEFNKKKILANFRKFSNMQKGHLTSERARKLHKIWMKKTTNEQRRLWGKMGARIAIKKARLTPSENKIKKILEELKLQHITHHPIKIDEKLTLNVDFFIENEKKVIIEVTEKQNNLTVAAQALAFRALQIRQANPNILIVCIVPQKMSSMGIEVLKRTFHKVFTFSNLEEFKQFISNITSST